MRRLVALALLLGLAGSTAGADPLHIPDFANSQPNAFAERKEGVHALRPALGDILAKRLGIEDGRMVLFASPGAGNSNVAGVVDGKGLKLEVHW